MLPHCKLIHLCHCGFSSFFTGALSCWSKKCFPQNYFFRADVIFTFSNFVNIFIQKTHCFAHNLKSLGSKDMYKYHTVACRSVPCYTIPYHTTPSTVSYHTIFFFHSKLRILMQGPLLFPSCFKIDLNLTCWCLLKFFRDLVWGHCATTKVISCSIDVCGDQK